MEGLVINMAFECMEDCIHLKACRRIQAIGKSHRLLVPRYCTEDCTAYVSGNSKVNYVTVPVAEDYVYACGGEIDGYGYFTPILYGKKLGDIVNELQEGEE
jgi:hypothetical protein